ncbi:MAG: flagellar hook capping FlgD N-terminal domain-containing protein [Pirellulaceae bacterium]
MSDLSFSSQLKQTDFLTLLTTQLRYQDPTSPVEQDTFISQLSQFSTLEGINNLNSGFEQLLKLQEISQGVELVGKNVSYQDPISGNLKSGEVEQVTILNGNLVATVDGTPVNIDRIAAIRA